MTFEFFWQDLMLLLWKGISMPKIQLQQMWTASSSCNQEWLHEDDPVHISQEWLAKNTETDLEATYTMVMVCNRKPSRKGTILPFLCPEIACVHRNVPIQVSHLDLTCDLNKPAIHSHWQISNTDMCNRATDVCLQCSDNKQIKV